MNFPHWATDRVTIVCAGVANGCAWAQSFAAQNINVGAVVTFCTIAVPAIVGAIIYIIKNVGPVWLKYLADRDAVRSSLLAAQMERLNRNLEDAKTQAEASKKLADMNAMLAKTASEQADRLQAVLTKTEERAVAAENHAATLAESLKTLTAKMDEMKQGMDKARENLHTIRDLANDERQSRMAAELSLAQLQNQIKVNREKIDDTTVKVDETRNQFEKIAHAGEQLADVASRKPSPAP